MWFNKDLSKYSALPLDGYLLWSDVMKNKYQGYISKGREGIKADTAPTLNFDQLMHLLKLKDFKNSEEVKKFDELTKEGQSYFLDEKSKVP